jgi:hypothetical protein
VTEQEWLAWCEATAARDAPPDDPDEQEPDPDGLPGPWEYDVEQLVAECHRVTAEEAVLAARAARQGLPGGQYITPGRRGPGQPGGCTANIGRAVGFAAGMRWDRLRHTARWRVRGGAAGDNDR